MGGFLPTTEIRKDKERESQQRWRYFKISVQPPSICQLCVGLVLEYKTKIAWQKVGPVKRLELKFGTLVCAWKRASRVRPPESASHEYTGIHHRNPKTWFQAQVLKPWAVGSSEGSFGVFRGFFYENLKQGGCPQRCSNPGMAQTGAASRFSTTQHGARAATP